MLRLVGLTLTMTVRVRIPMEAPNICNLGLMLHCAPGQGTSSTLALSPLSLIGYLSYRMVQSLVVAQSAVVPAALNYISIRVMCEAL